nr:MAG TPA: hypothetical protein [Bacteriophage sp.]
MLCEKLVYGAPNQLEYSKQKLYHIRSVEDIWIYAYGRRIKAFSSRVKHIMISLAVVVLSF